MTTPAKNGSDADASDVLKRELERGLVSGGSMRTPDQIRNDMRERSICEGIERGLADLRAGNTVPHDAAMAEVDAVIDGPGGPRRGNL